MAVKQKELKRPPPTDGSEDTRKDDAVRKAAKVVIETNREALKELERH